MQIINIQQQSIYHLTYQLKNLHYLQRTHFNNLYSLLLFIYLQFFSITFAVGQNAATTTISARTPQQHHTNPVHHHSSTTLQSHLSHSSSINTATTVHPTSSNTFKSSDSISTSSLPKNSQQPPPPQHKNNLNQFPTTLSTDDLTTATKSANHRHHHRIPNIPLSSSDTLLNTVPIFPIDYDNLRPPKEEDGSPCITRLHIWVLSINSINEDSMTYTADIFVSQSWRDHRLNIPDSLVNTTTNYRLLPLSWLNYMWRPDSFFVEKIRKNKFEKKNAKLSQINALFFLQKIFPEIDSFFKNAKQVTFQEMTVPNHYLWMYEDKKILYMVKLTLLLSCSMKFQSYPHDIQQCKLQIESCHNVYSSGNFTCVQVVFRFKRRLGYFLFHTYIPTCLIVIMSWISFYIKPEAVPARVTLCVTSLLTLSTQHAQSQKSLPPVSYIKAIDIFMSSCTVFVFSSLMEYLIINIVYLNHNNYAAYGNSANYNGNYYTGLSSNCLNAFDFLDSDEPQLTNKQKYELNKKKLNKRLKKNLKQRQKSSWLNRLFTSSSSSGSRDCRKDNVNNESTYPITNLNTHFQQTPLTNALSTNNINQNVPTSTSLTNLSLNHLKENNNLPNSTTLNGGGSIAVIAQSTNCGHCIAENKRRHSKDSLCRRHVQCIQLTSSGSATNLATTNHSNLNSVITTTALGGGTTSTTTTQPNLTTFHNHQLTNQPKETTSKKMKAYKQCSKQNLRRNQDSQHPSSNFEYVNSEYRPHFSSDLNMQSVLDKRDRAILVDKISRWAFPLSFILLNIIYWTVYLND